MTQEVFPEIQTATKALEQLVATTESEITQLKEAITEKKQRIRRWRKALNAVRSQGTRPKVSPAAA